MSQAKCAGSFNPDCDNPDCQSCAEYDRFVASCLKDCRCCRACNWRPCEGAMAGGLCDELDCRCDDFPRDDGDQEDDA